MPELKKKKLILVDTNALMHRAYHALPPLTDKKGQVVNAVYGFTSLLLKILKELRPDYIICTFDMAAPTFRHTEFKEYKAGRVKPPEEFYTQIPKIKEVIKAFGIPIYEKAGFEADDIIGTLSVEAPKIFGSTPYEIIVLTGDLDTLQLVNKNIEIYTFKKGISDTVLYDEAAVKERYGLEPSQMIDYKGLRGDPSDNIPGVPGIGEKTASGLLKEFGSIDEIYKTLEETKGVIDARIKPKIAAKLIEFKEQAYFSKHLGTIKLDVPVEFNLEESRVKPVERAKVVQLFQDFNFFSLISRLNNNERENLFDQNGAGAPAGKENLEENKVKIDIAQDPSRIKILEEKIKKEGKVFFAIEYETKEGKNSLSAIGFSVESEIWEIKRENIRGEIFQEIKNIFAYDDILKIGYDLKTCIKVFASEGIKLNVGSKDFDIMIGAYLLSPGKRDYSLEKISFEYLGRENSQDTKDSVGQCADLARRLEEVISKKMEDKNLVPLAREIEFPLIAILSKMEMEGVKIDKDRLDSVSLKIAGRIDELKKEIFALADGEFNINSTRELATVLFEKLSIPAEGVKRTKTNYSTAADTLALIKPLHPIVNLVIQYRELAKIKSTYSDALPVLISPETGRVHTSFNQALTATGRLSSSDPNLQNIPIKTDIGNEIRMAFVAGRFGWQLLSFDYSQIELRIIASMANDEKMLGIFSDGGDIHRQTAAEVYEISPENVTDKMRSEAKALNFGIIYGMSVHGFSEATGMSRVEAKEFIDKYLAKFSAINMFRVQLIEEAQRTGYAKTIFGRMRYLPELRSPNFQVKSAAERMAINMPVQGTAADIIKLAMIAVDKKFGAESDIALVLQVHDELVFEVSKSRLEFYAEEIKKIMENVYLLKAPLKVSAYQGENWGEMREVIKL